MSEMDSPAHTILFVDDVGFNRVMIERAMQGSNYAVLCATSAEEGLKLLRDNHHIAAVVTDLMMPEIDGLEFFRRAQKLERIGDQGLVPTPPFILLTASNDPKKIQQAVEMGFMDVMVKPFHHSRLDESLARALKTVPIKSGKGNATQGDPMQPVLKACEAVRTTIEQKDRDTARRMREVLNGVLRQLDDFVDPEA